MMTTESSMARMSQVIARIETVTLGSDLNDLVI